MNNYLIVSSVYFEINYDNPFHYLLFSVKNVKFTIFYKFAIIFKYYFNFSYDKSISFKLFDMK